MIEFVLGIIVGLNILFIINSIINEKEFKNKIKKIKEEIEQIGK